MDQTQHNPVGTPPDQHGIDANAKRVQVRTDDAISKGAGSGGAGIYDRPDPAAARAQRMRRIVALVAILSAIFLAIVLALQTTAPRTS
jgi:hypothetical protein